MCVSVCVCVRVLFSCCQAIKILCQCRNRNLASFAVIYRAFSASQADRETDRRTDTQSEWQFDSQLMCVCVCECVEFMMNASGLGEMRKTIRFAESSSWEKDSSACASTLTP